MRERPSIIPDLNVYQLRTLRNRVSNLRWERVISVAMNRSVTSEEHVKLAKRYDAFTKKLDQVKAELARKEEILDA